METALGKGLRTALFAINGRRGSVEVLVCEHDLEYGVCESSLFGP